MRKVTVAAAFVVAAALISSAVAYAGNGNGNAKPKLLPPDQAQALASAPGYATAGPLRQVTPADVVQASQQPGAVVEGRLPDQAASGERRLARATAGGCWSRDLWGSWGTWPYDQHVDDSTYWCSDGYNLTYRVTHVLYSATICNGHDPYSYKYSGGVGYAYVATTTGSYFDCPTTLVWFTIHRNDYMNVWHNYYGGAWIDSMSG